MRQTLGNMLKIIRQNGKTLVLFEVYYRLLGALLILPLADWLLNLAIRLSPYSVLTNRVIIDFFLLPTTWPLLLVLVLVMSVFLVYELIALTLLFHYAYHDVPITLRELIKLSLVKTRRIVERYHIVLLLPSLIFLLLVHLFHIAPLASSFALPEYFIEQLFIYRTIQIVFIVFMLFLLFLFIENLFTLQIFTIEESSMKNTYRKMRTMLFGRRGRLTGEFFLLNAVMNALLYGFYFLLIACIALIVMLIRGQAVVLSVILTMLYIVYLAVAAIATFILIPLNAAWITTRYEQIAKSEGIKLPVPTKKAFKIPALNPKRTRLTIAVAVIAIFTLNITSVFAAVREERVPLFYLNQPEIIAHRGSSLRAPENTLAAFDLALYENADAVEFDVHLSADGVPVVLHDFTLGRTTNISGNPRVDAVSFEAIRALDAGSWFSAEFAGEQVPTLNETLALIDRDATIYLEPKINDTDLNAQIIALLEIHDLIDNTVILSFNQQTLEDFKNRNAQIETLYLITTFIGDFDRILNLDYVDHYGFEVSFLLNNPRYVSRIQDAGKRVSVWTVNDTERIRAATELGVDGIITDDPILAREAVYSTQTRSLYANILRQLFSD